MELNKAATAAQRLTRVLRCLASGKTECEDAEELEEALVALRQLGDGELETALRERGDTARAKRDAYLAARRESLHRAAQQAQIPSKRVGDFDRVDIFKLTYFGKRVRLELGSERVAEVEEADGAELFKRIVEAREELDRDVFDRGKFFGWLLLAYRLALLEEMGRDGWVPVRPYISLLALARNRQLLSSTEKPKNKGFIPYPAYKFAYDLARFGVEGWKVERYTVSTRTPNMAAVSRGDSVTLPSLDSLEAHPHQVSALKIQPTD